MLIKAINNTNTNINTRNRSICANKSDKRD